MDTDRRRKSQDPDPPTVPADMVLRAFGYDLRCTGAMMKKK